MAATQSRHGEAVSLAIIVVAMLALFVFRSGEEEQGTVARPGLGGGERGNHGGNGNLANLPGHLVAWYSWCFDASGTLLRDAMIARNH